MMVGKRAAVAALWLALVLAVAEGGSRLALRLTRPFLSEEIRTTPDIFREQSGRIRALIQPDTTRLLVLDSVLGWRYRPNHRDSVNQTNADDVRSAREYSHVPGAGVIRVSAFGNSFVYCNEVKNEDSWPAQIELMYPGIEVLNYGVGGYGVDQAYLRFLAEGSRLSPRIVVIGFATDDLSRVVNVYRRFRSNREIPLVKPRYVLSDHGELVLLPTPVRGVLEYAQYLEDPQRVIELGAHDQWYEPAIYQDPLYDYSAMVRLVTETWIRARRRYLGPDRLVQGGVFNPSSSAFQIQVALFQRFADSAQARGARLLVVLFPDMASVKSVRRGRKTVLASLLTALRARGLEYVDLTDAFRDAGSQAEVEQWFMPGGHYSPEGNRVAARWLGRRIVMLR